MTLLNYIHNIRAAKCAQTAVLRQCPRVSGNDAKISGECPNVDFVHQQDLV